MNNNSLKKHASSVALKELDQTELLTLCRVQLPTETAAFDELARRLMPRIHRHALHYLQHAEDAVEVTQEVLIRLYRNLHRFEGRSAFSTWLYRIVENQCHSFVHARSRHTMTEHLVELFQIHETSIRLDDEENELDTECVSSVLVKLPSATQQVLNLRFVADQSLEEISQTLDIGLSAAKMRLYRALESLKTAYASTQSAAA